MEFDGALVDLKGNAFGLALCHKLNLPMASFWVFPFEGNEALYTSNPLGVAVRPTYESRVPAPMGFVNR